MKTIEEIERLSPADLERLAETPQAAANDGLSDALDELRSAAALAERGAEALDDKPRRRVPRWTLATVPALAAAALAAVLIFTRPAPVYPDAAVARMEEAFNEFSEALQNGMTVFSEPFQEPSAKPFNP